MSGAFCCESAAQKAIGQRLSVGRSEVLADSVSVEPPVTHSGHLGSNSSDGTVLKPTPPLSRMQLRLSGIHHGPLSWQVHPGAARDSRPLDSVFELKITNTKIQ